MRILFCTDGSPAARQAVQFGLLLARQGSDTLRLVGVVEDHAGAEQIIHAALETLGAELQAIGAEYDTKLRRGQAAEQILDEAAEWQADLIVVGQLGRRGLTRFIMGGTATRIVQYAPCMVLLVKSPRQTLRKILACTGGRQPGLRDVAVAGQLAAQSGAEVAVLHVMSQVALIEKGYRPELEAPAAELIMQQTREGQHLTIALQTLHMLGVNCTARVRHGVVVDEIVAETREVDYDLLVIGAHVAHGLNRWLLDDVTAHVLEEVHVPVLVVRTSQK